MFDRIAHRYDLLNHVLSAGIDIRWRRRAVRMLGQALERSRGEAAGSLLLDVATGTGDLAIEAMRLEPAGVVGVDPAEAMLEVAREKIERRGMHDAISLRTAASEALPFDDATFDGALVAFGVRNFEDRGAGLREISRVLRPGGPLVVLEFSTPRGPVAPLFSFYFRKVLPRIGALVSGDRDAYTYLHDSVQVFPDGQAFLDEMRGYGFRPVRAERLTFGIASLYLATATG